MKMDEILMNKMSNYCSLDKDCSNEEYNTTKRQTVRQFLEERNAVELFTEAIDDKEEEKKFFETPVITESFKKNLKERINKIRKNKEILKELKMKRDILKMISNVFKEALKDIKKDIN